MTDGFLILTLKYTVATFEGWEWDENPKYKLSKIMEKCADSGFFLATLDHVP